jgi:hypothetical protein
MWLLIFCFPCLYSERSTRGTSVRSGAPPLIITYIIHNEAGKILIFQIFFLTFAAIT